MDYPSIQDVEDEIINEFSLFENPMDKYDYLIDVGKQMPELSAEYKTEENLVKGCQSKVWLHSYLKDGRVIYEADSNTVITKGIMGLLTRILSNQKPDDIVNANLGFLDKIDLRAHLSSQRSNGLTAMIKNMKLYALGFKSKMEEAKS